MILCKACANDLGALVRLWKLCFGDEDDYPERFLARCLALDGCEVLCAKEGTALCAMECVIDVTDEKNSLTGAYLYAVCTHPDYRGQGLCRRLISMANEERDFLCLIPAEDSLFGFYRSLGFTLPMTVAACFAKTPTGLLSVPTPSLSPVSGLDDLIKEGLVCAKDDGKVYKFCCIWKGKSVIMKDKGLCTPHPDLKEPLVCAPLPI